METQTYSGIIYLYRSKTTNKSYVGQTIDEERRKHQHMKADKNTYFHNAIKKYGYDDFEYSVIETLYNENKNELYKELIARESYWIDYYNSLAPNGYNLIKGGNDYVISDATRKKISESVSGEKNGMYGKEGPMLGKHHTDEAKQIMSIKAKERLKNKENHPMYGRHNTGGFKGKHHTDESKELLRNSHLGKPLSDKTKKIFTQQRTGRIWMTNGIDCKFVKDENKIQYLLSIGYKKGRLLKGHSEETKKKIGNAHRGKIVSKETRKKLSATLTGRHRVYHNDGTYHYET